VANDFDTSGTFGNESPFDGATSELRRAIAESLDALRHNGVSPVATYVAALAVAIGILVWTAARAGKMHAHAMPRFARRVPVVAQGGIAGHAAVLGAPATSRALAILELKSALEEEIATRLGLDRAPPPEQLVARLRAARLLDETGARALSRLLATMARAETRLGIRPSGLALRREGPTDADVLTLAAQVRDVRRRLGLEPGPV
jgi:adenylosuccinate lyase